MPRKRKEPVYTFMVYVSKDMDDMGKVSVGQIGVRDESGKISHYRRFQYLDEIGSRVRKEIVEKEKKPKRKRSGAKETKESKTAAKKGGKKKGGRKKGSTVKKADTKKSGRKSGKKK